MVLGEDKGDLEGWAWEGGTLKRVARPRCADVAR